MSTDAPPADSRPGASSDSGATRSHGSANTSAMDLDTVRIVRFTLGATLSAVIAFGFEWPLSFLTPVLTIAFLSMPLPGVSPRKWIILVGYVLGAVLLGTVFTLFFIPYPLVYVLTLGLVLFHTYYLVNRRGPIIFALMCLLAVLILPMMGMAHELLALSFAAYFAFSATLSVIIFAFAHWLLPDPPADPALAEMRFQPDYSAPAVRAALKSTFAVLPLVVLFVALELHSQLLVMVFAAIFSLIPDLSTGWAAGRKSLRSTLLGGLAAVAIYWLLVAVPEFHFFLALWISAMLIFARLIFSDHPLAKYMGSAAIAMTILVSGSLGSEADFVDELVTRIVLISAATLYVVAVIAVLDRYAFRTDASSG